MKQNSGHPFLKRLNRYSIYSILIIGLLSFFVVFINKDKNYSEKIPVVQSGVLELDKWDFDKNGSIQLSGMWEFYYKQLLKYEDFHDDQGYAVLSGYINVPGNWKNYSVNNEKIDKMAYGTYKLKVRLNKEHEPEVLGIRVPYSLTAYNLMVDDELLDIKENDTSRKRTVLQPRNIFFKPKSNHFEIIIQIPYQVFYDGGTHLPLYMGSAEAIRYKEKNDQLREMMLFACLIVMGVYHILLYSFLHRKKYILYFGLLCVTIALRSLYVNEALLVSHFITPSFKVFQFLNAAGGLLCILLFGSFIYELYTSECSANVLKAIKAYCIGMIIISIALPYSIYGYLRGINNLVLIICGIYYLSIILKAAFYKRKGAFIMLFAMLVMLLSAINDVLYVSNMKRFCLVYGMTTYGTIIFVFALAILLSKIYADAFISVDNLSKKLLSLDKLKDEFLANTSHELRTPLNGIIGITESLVEGAAGEIPDRVKKSLCIILASGKRLNNLVNDILDYSKLKNSDIKLSLESVNLYGLVDNVMTVLKMTDQTKQIILKNEILKDMPYIYADEARVQQIMYNLIGNAIKFTEKGEVTVSAKLAQDFIEITIQDTGIGIAEDKIEEIFKSFEQIDFLASRRYSGTGLGLSITKKLIELHGGSIRCESVLGKGSSFIFTLPKSNFSYDRMNKAVSPSQQLINTQTAISFESHNATSKLRILVVDDEPINIQVLINQLSLHNYYVVTATNGKDALRLVEVAKLDLIILDAMMPEMSGYEVCRKVREKYTLIDLPILMLTANSQLNNICLAFECGINDYVTKPFEKQELLARVKTLVTMKNAVSESIKDPLTGVYNRKRVFELAELIFEEHKKEDKTMAVMMIDIDDFKYINDTYGHAAGDDILIEVVLRCTEMIREIDVFGRYGGEEFVIILPHITREDAIKLADGIRSNVHRRLVRSSDEEELTVTISLGIAVNRKHSDTVYEMIKKADQALYKAKKNGKNRVEIAE
ncbi:diguanylate cyclase [Cellulosilyticum sp. I15G10I2]|uniref:diguanylate cyclase n=1 Tax=Cellulosilyticum sp. I15G10I2 TaxID=1892843 RepID=UPI00085C283D|nr:diguanylate cyclase [Cellulosilyticum sp. I15G10I2]